MSKKQVIWALAALNALLLVALVFKFGGEPRAHAQVGGRGDFVMVPAKATGFNNGVIYVVDTRNGVVAAFSYDNNRKQLEAGRNSIDVRRIMESDAVGGPTRRP
jgi:hypothetical protein